MVLYLLYKCKNLHFHIFEKPILLAFFFNKTKKYFKPLFLDIYKMLFVPFILMTAVVAPRLRPIEQGRQREPSLKTLHFPLSTEF